MMRLRHLKYGTVAILTAIAVATIALGAQGGGPTPAERAAARAAALTPGAQVIAGVLRMGIVGETPYEAIKPAQWNGTLVLDLDFVSDTWGAVQRRWFLEHGYAIGGPNRQQDASAYEMRDHVENFLTIRRIFIEKFGAPTRTLSFGVSRAGFPALTAIDMHPEIFAGTVAMSGGGHGVVGTLLTKLDAVWAIKTLVDPASPLTVVNLPRPAGEGRYPPDEAFSAIVEKAKATPQGRARLVLAGAFDQAPTWSIRNSPQPGPADFDAQMENVVTNFAGQFPHRIRYLNEAMAGGNFSWNHGVNYRDQLERSGLIELVRHAYAKAGASLDADLDTLAKAPRIAADQAAVAKAEHHGYSGKLTGPVLLVKTIGDSYDPPMAEMAYEDLVRKAGTQDLVRTVYVNRPGHATQTVLEKIVAFQTLIDRFESGTWPSARELPDRMNTIAAEIRKTMTPDPGASTFVYHRPATAIRTWDFTNWGTYAPPPSR